MLREAAFSAGIKEDVPFYNSIVANDIPSLPFAIDGNRRPIGRLPDHLRIAAGPCADVQVSSLRLYGPLTRRLRIVDKRQAEILREALDDICRNLVDVVPDPIGVLRIVVVGDLNQYRRSICLGDLCQPGRGDGLY